MVLLWLCCARVLVSAALNTCDKITYIRLGSFASIWDFEWLQSKAAYTTGQKYGILFISEIFCIFVECAGCFCSWNTFLRTDITFGGVNQHLTAKWSAKVPKQLFRYFSQLHYGYNSCCSFIRLLPYPFVCCIEILFKIPLFIYRLFRCVQQRISVVGSSHRRTWGVVLVYHKVMYTKS